jgi:hypothetical protein
MQIKQRIGSLHNIFKMKYICRNDYYKDGKT